MRAEDRWTAAGIGLLGMLGMLIGACGGDDESPPRGVVPASADEAPVPWTDPAHGRALALAGAALRSLGEDPMRGLLLARQAARIVMTPEVAEALHRALDGTRSDTPFDAHRGSTLAAGFSPDGTHILTTSLDTTGRIWDLEGREVAVLRGHVGSIHQAAFSPDGTRIVTASVDHTARVWDLEGTLLHTLRGHTAEVLAAAFSPDGTCVLTVSLDGTARLWSASGEAIATLAVEDDPIRTAWFSPTGDLVLGVTENGALSIWTAEGERRLLTIPPADAVETLVVSPTGSGWLALTDGSSPVLGWGEDIVRSLEGHAALTLDAAFSPDGSRIVTASLDGTVRIWDADGNEQAVLCGHGGGVFAARFSPDGERVLTVSSDRTARVWDLEGKELARIGGSETPVVDAAFSPSGESILTRAYREGPACLWDLDGDLRQVLPDDSGCTIRAVFSPDGTLVLSLDRHLTAHVRSANEAALLAAADQRIDRHLTVEEQKRYDAVLHPNDPPQKGTTPFAASRPAPDTSRARGDYAGTVVCASCHREAYDGWFASSHARTSYFATEEDLPPDVMAEKTVEHLPGRTTYRREGDGWIAETVGADGEVHAYPLVMISGHLRVRFFVARMPDGRLQVLPAMYELPTGKWFDYSHLIFGAGTRDFATPPVIEPGTASFWTGPVRSWDAACAQCHMSGKTPIEARPDGTGPRLLWRAHAVDCEACHGPGRLHAEAWRRLEMDEALPKLETLPRGDLVAVCTRCHQEGNLLDAQFTLGADLYEYIDPTLAVDPERADPAGRPLELIYDGLPFAMSACANAAGLTCSTCHAPHGSKHRSLLRRPHEDGSFCTPCHQDLIDEGAGHHHHAPGGSGAPCIACHMPFLTIERGHGAVADHTIGIPRMGLVSDRVQPDACTWCHSGGWNVPPDAPILGEDVLREAYEEWWPGRGWPRPWMDALARARMREEGVGSALVAAIEDRSNPREARASAARLLGRYAGEVTDAIFDASYDEDSLVRRNALRSLVAVEGERADARFMEALSDPSWAVRVIAARSALEGFGRVEANRPLLEAILPVLEQDARRVPDGDPRWFRLGAAYDLLGDKEKALAAYERKLVLDPFAHAVRRHVKNLRALLGKDEDDDGTSR